MSKYRKAKVDPTAYAIAIAARKQCIRRVAKIRVEAQEFPQGADITNKKADAMEALAREWGDKAHRALHPVTSDEILALLNQLPKSDLEQISTRWPWHCEKHEGRGATWRLDDDDDTEVENLVSIYNECAAALNAIEVIKELHEEAGPAPDDDPDLSESEPQAA